MADPRPWRRQMKNGEGWSASLEGTNSPNEAETLGD